MQQQRLGHCFTSHSGTLYLSACSLFIFITKLLPFYFIIILMWFPVINVGHYREQCDNAQMKRWRKEKLYTKICHTANDWSISLSSSTSFHIHCQPLFWTPRCWLMAGIFVGERCWSTFDQRTFMKNGKIIHISRKKNRWHIHPVLICQLPAILL